MRRDVPAARPPMERNDVIRQLAAQGVTRKAIAQQFGVSPSWVGKIVARGNSVETPTYPEAELETVANTTVVCTAYLCQRPAWFGDRCDIHHGRAVMAHG